MKIRMRRKRKNLCRFLFSRRKKNRARQGRDGLMPVTRETKKETERAKISVDDDRAYRLGHRPCLLVKTPEFFCGSSIPAKGKHAFSYCRHLIVFAAHSNFACRRAHIFCFSTESLCCLLFCCHASMKPVDAFRFSLDFSSILQCSPVYLLVYPHIKT